MWVLTDIADWWDRQHKDSEKALDSFVQDHPNWFGVVVAGSVDTAMQLGAGLVDVIRIGDGVKEGGVKGYGKDALRLLAFAPAAGKAARSVLARVLVINEGNICTWVSAAKALRQVGAKAFASIDDLAQAAGVDVSELGGAFVDKVVPFIRQLGARVTNLGHPGNLAEVVNSVRGQGVVLFSVRWKMGLETVGHTLYAFKDTLGRIRIADRSGAIVSALSELESSYPGIRDAVVYGTSALVEGPRLMIADGIATIAMEVRAMLTVDPETAAQALEARKQALKNHAFIYERVELTPEVRASIMHASRLTPVSVHGAPGPIGVQALSHVGADHGVAVHAHRMRVPGTAGTRRPHPAVDPGSRIHVVHQGDQLPLLARHYYGHANKWPVLYSANRKVIGDNPNRIHPGQRLVIPRLAAVTAVKRKRA